MTPGDLGRRVRRNPVPDDRKAPPAGAFHICYCLAVRPPLALVAYTTSVPWPPDAPLPLGVRLLTQEEAAAPNQQRAFRLHLNRQAKDSARCTVDSEPGCAQWRRDRNGASPAAPGTLRDNTGTRETLRTEHSAPRGVTVPPSVLVGSRPCRRCRVVCPSCCWAGFVGRTVPSRASGGLMLKSVDRVTPIASFADLIDGVDDPGIRAIGIISTAVLTDRIQPFSDPVLKVMKRVAVCGLGERRDGA